MNNEQVKQFLKQLKKEAEEWRSGYPGRSRSEKSAWVDGVTASLAVIEPTYKLSNAALEMLSELFDL